MRNENGISMNGHIENINKIKAVKCNCTKCGWAKKAYGTIYCKYYHKNNPKKQKCKRFYVTQGGEKGIKPRTSAKDISKYEPSFPWERPLY